jgi:hypothetical protein
VPRHLNIAVLLVAIATANAQQLTFMGRKVTLTKPEVDHHGGSWPKGPASVCLEGPWRQCYTMPGNYGRNPEVSSVHVDAETPALLFSAWSGLASGSRIHIVLLRPGDGHELENLFVNEIELSEQSRHALWSDPSISPAKIFMTADYASGPEECHHCEHRFIISAYLFDRSAGLYFLGDQYMTVRSYNGDNSKVDVLGAERPEILARLKRVVQQNR